MTIPHIIVTGFFSVPVAVVGAVGTVLALAFDPTIVAAAAVTVIMALTASIVAIITKLGDNKRATVEASVKAAENAAMLAIELAKISRSVDGVASKQVDKVTTLEEKVADLLAQLAEQKNIASTLAAVHAATSVAASRPHMQAPLTDAAPAESLKQIDKNTADTAKNTARTEAVVQDLKDKP